MSEIPINKGGRPSLPDYRKKTCPVKVMFSSVDMIYLRACAKECGLRLAEYVYRSAMNQETTSVLNKDELAAISDIRNVGNNLNQITRRVHLGEHLEEEIKEIVTFISGILRKLR